MHDVGLSVTLSLTIFHLLTLYIHSSFSTTPFFHSLSLSLCSGWRRVGLWRTNMLIKKACFTVKCQLPLFPPSFPLCFLQREIVMPMFTLNHCLCLKKPVNTPIYIVHKNGNIREETAGRINYLSISFSLCPSRSRSASAG